MTVELQANQECTCGSCIDGWLSPRMKERLEGEVDFLHYVSSSLLEDVARDLPADDVLPEWCVAADVSLHYVPMQLYAQMTPRFYRGHMLVTEAVMQTLLSEGPAAVPTPAAVSARLAPDVEASKPAASAADAKAVRQYLAAGGTVEFALEALLDRAEEKSPRGAEYRCKPAVREEEADFEREVQSLPRCAHDLDFDLVRRKIGLPAERSGAHWCFLSDSEDEDDNIQEPGQEALYEGQKTAKSS